ncbi:hypothetical protein F4678DRAFT_470877 [Xylaria arbuscula]|nr:hypothetical protein F4678DRAFT_470877 [Xylaria arbuscula]
MSSASTTTPTGGTIGVKLIGVLPDVSRPLQYRYFCEESDKFVTYREGHSKPTQCLFLADDGSLKWVAVNAGVFPGQWSDKMTDLNCEKFVFPPFPAGSWNIGQIRRFGNGEIGFSQTLKMPLKGIENAWHPNKIEFTELEIVRQSGFWLTGERFHVKHPSFQKPVLLNMCPWIASSKWKRSLEAETEVYRRIDGLGMAPEFLGHVTYQGAIIGFLLEWIEDAQPITKKDKVARLKAVKKLHSLGITHGTALRYSFLKRGEDMLMVDFYNARFDNLATDTKKEEDIERICDFKVDWCVVITADEIDDIPRVDEFIDFMSNDEICWTDDSEAGKNDHEVPCGSFHI